MIAATLTHGAPIYPSRLHSANLTPRFGHFSQAQPQDGFEHPWHAIRTFANHEIKVADILANPETFNLPTYCPRYPAVFTRNHRRVSTVLPYLSTYIFARWDAYDAHLWHALRAVPGLQAFLGNPIVPDPVPEAHLDALRALIGPDGEIFADHLTAVEIRPPSIVFALDDIVLVNRGPFATLIGSVTSLDPANIFITVKISSILGRDHDIKMPTEWCDRLESGELLSTTTARSGPILRRRRQDRSRQEGVPS